MNILKENRTGLIYHMDLVLRKIDPDYHIRLSENGAA